MFTSPTPSNASVNISRLAERNEWAAVFGVTPGELVAAIKAVGHDAEAIWMYLRNKVRQPAARGEGVQQGFLFA